MMTALSPKVYYVNYAIVMFCFIVSIQSIRISSHFPFLNFVGQTAIIPQTVNSFLAPLLT